MNNTEKNSIDKKQLALENMKEIQELEEKARRELAGSPDQVMLSHVLKEDGITNKEIIFRNPTVEWTPTDKFRIALVMAPSWSILFPPYSLAKLTGLLRHFGYSVKGYDINVEAYHYFLEHHGQDYWTTERYFLWAVEENFKKYLLPDLKPLLDNIVNDILNSDVQVVGLSLFNTNAHAAFYIARELRRLSPDLCILAGGPETITGVSYFQEKGLAYNLFNYIFVGESEDNLIHLLEDLPNELPMNVILGTTNSRLKLEEYPFPDYQDYDIRNYLEHGVSIETSRGCVAQCSFCSETYFWKFRSITPERIVDEMEHQIKLHKVRRFWFVDSLANGNLKNFERLVDLIRERNLNIKWHSMARCDGRMDFIFLRKVVASGCTALSFGVESGSQKVLNDMRKKVEIWEIENNLRDTRRTGMFNHVHWQVGFPTEEPIDHFHSMQLIYNARKWIGNISPGFTTGIASGSHNESNYREYGIVGTGPKYDYSVTFLNQWYTDNYKNTVIHRFIRLKLFYIWLEILKDHAGSIIMNTNQSPGTNLKNFYNFEFKKRDDIDYVERDFNVNFTQFTDSYADSVVNEYIGFAYLLHKYFKSCKFKFTCRPNEDLNIFGDFLARNYTCDLEFNIDKKGNYSFAINHELLHTTDDDHLKQKYIDERERCDQSFKQTIEKKGHISEWQTSEPQIRESIHEQYRKKND